MDIKNTVITSISLTILVAILFTVGFYTVKYLQEGYKSTDQKVADSPKVEIEQDNSSTANINSGPESEGIEENNGSVMGSQTNKPKEEDSFGIADETKPVVKPVTKPVVKPTTTNNGFDETTKPITLRSVDFTIPSPRVKEVDDNYIRFDYTFNLSQNAKTYLNNTGFSYYIDAENCRDYFNEDEYIFEGSYRRGHIPTTFSLELPEEVMNEDNNYLEKATFTIEVNGKTLITGSTYIPNCE